VERLAADETEGLVAGNPGNGVDGGQVDLVDTGGEIRDPVALGGGGALEGKGITPRPAGQYVCPGAAIDPVGPTTAEQRVAAPIPGTVSPNRVPA